MVEQSTKDCADGLNFMECTPCSLKPGTRLCVSCVSNRRAILELKCRLNRQVQYLDEKDAEIESLKRALEDSLARQKSLSSELYSYQVTEAQPKQPAFSQATLQTPWGSFSFKTDQFRNTAEKG